MTAEDASPTEGAEPTVPRDPRTVEQRTGGARSADPALANRIAELAPWFHNLHLPDGTRTAPHHPLGDFPARKWREIEPLLPERLDGWTALDVGCNAGFHAFELAKRGARVTAVDHEPRYLEQARWAAEQMGLAERVEVRQADVFDLARQDGPLGDRRFDLVLFLGVFYHLRYPLLGLDAVAQRAQRLLVFQSLSIPGAAAEPLPDLDLTRKEELLRPDRPQMAFVEYALAGDPTNWWIPNRAAVEAMLRSAGMEVLERSGEDVVLCRPQADPVRRDWARSYLDAVMGRRP